MNKKIFILGLTLILVLSACGAKEPAVPTISPVDIKNTAEAAAMTMVAQTQAAIPTSTPTEMPTETPLPTDTPVPLPTLESTAMSLPTPTTAAAGGDPCATRVLGSPKGKSTIIRIVNNVKAAVTVSMYLNETADHNECGYRSYQIGPRDSVTISDLVQGCYNFWAFNNDKKFLVNVGSGTMCINNPDKWTFEISQSGIKNTTP